MEIKINKKQSPSFQRVIVLKRAEKAFNNFKQTNNMGSQIDKDVYSRYLEKTIAEQEKNPMNVIIDYVKDGKSKAKKLVIAIGKNNKQITRPQVLRPGLNKGTDILHETKQNEVQTHGIPNYLQQISAFAEATGSLEKALSKEQSKNINFYRLSDY